jgi:hypothetical protein
VEPLPAELLPALAAPELLPDVLPTVSLPADERVAELRDPLIPAAELLPAALVL